MRLVHWVNLTLAAALGCIVSFADAQPVPLEPGDRVLVTGNTFAERLAQSGFLEAALQAAYPDAGLTIWQVPWSGDEVSLRPREAGVPTIEDHVRSLKPTVLILCYGMSESFAGEAGVARFRQDLASHLTNLRSIAGAGTRVILVSPIAHEDLGAPLPTGDAVAGHNRSLGLYTRAMREVATANDAAFVDLFDVNLEDSDPLTSNGIHPTERGFAFYVRKMGEQLGWWPTENTAPDAAALASARTLREIACDKHWLTRMWYRPTNTAYVWGGRHEPFGIVNFPPEMAQLRRMIEARTAFMHSMDKPGPLAVLADRSDIPLWESTPTKQVLPEDSWTPAQVVAKGTETSLGSLDILPPDEFIKSFTLPEGYEISCFVSEQDFPELGNAVGLAFDNRHRLWVLTIPTYPHLMPGERPRCKLLILEDTDADGRADKRTIFADGLYVPTGFAVDADGTVYIGQSPDLLRLRDTDGDDRADRREIIASGFAMPDSHHQLGAFEWDPSGAFLFHEGVFCRANVETPWGTLRTRDAAVWRFDPRIGRLEILSHSGYANPWGHVFDDYGQSILADASGGANFDFSHVISPFTYPNKPAKPAQMLNRGRPTAGCEIIASRQFPDQVQGSFLINQCIGFHGTRWDMLKREGSTWSTERMPMDLVSSSDTNFRPVAMEIGPDGTLFIVDWSNPLIGHMQYSVRDPRRDHDHGRIWRVRYTDLPLVSPPDIVDADVPTLLELLRIPETNTRQLVRRRLQTLPIDQVEPQLRRWLDAIQQADPLKSRLTLEALWILSAQGLEAMDILERALSVETPEARAGAVRVIRYWLVEGRIKPGLASEMLLRAIDDDNQLVRLEALVACGFLGTPDAVQIAARASGHEMDSAMRVVFGEVISYLGAGSGIVSDVVERVRLERMPARELETHQITEAVAQVMLARDDVALETRQRALARVTGFKPGDRARVLIDLLKSARNPSQVRSAGELLLAESATEIAPAIDTLSALARDAQARDSARVAALAVLVTQVPDVAKTVDADPADLLEATDALTDGPAPTWITDRLRAAVESGQVDPSHAIEQLARLTAEPGDLDAWLTGLVDGVAETGFDQWSRAHEAAMAALRVLNTSGRPMSDAYAVAVPDTQTLALGRAIFDDEGIGCARCHGHDGRGLEGFPPLAGSPWLLGNPERPAAIVVDGLYGKVHLPDGRIFDSAMEPLGSVLDNTQIAAVLTYARNAWGNFAPPVSTDVVSQARAASSNAPWHIETIALFYPLARDRVVPTAQADEPSAHRSPPSPLLAPLMSLALLLIPTLIAAIAGVVLANKPGQS
jgi:mono/diheme cytochrome c family protein